MSRIGRAPITVPDGVVLEVGEGNHVTVRGPRGELSQQLNPIMRIARRDGTVVVERPSDERQHRAQHGLTRALLANMVEGVSRGFQKSLEVVGVGYRAQKDGEKLVLLVGFSHPVVLEPPPRITFALEGANRVHVQGIDKQLVGETAAQIRRVRPPEPYKGKGIRYAGEVVRRKAGKAGRTGGKRG